MSVRCLAIGLLGLLALPSFAQEPAYAPPRTGWGAPDLQGYWSNRKQEGSNVSSAAQHISKANPPTEDVTAALAAHLSQA
jgi:hypothetical protein